MFFSFILTLREAALYLAASLHLLFESKGQNSSFISSGNSLLRVVSKKSEITSIPPYWTADNSKCIRCYLGAYPCNDGGRSFWLAAVVSSLSYSVPLAESTLRSGSDEPSLVGLSAESASSKTLCRPRS